MQTSEQINELAAALAEAQAAFPKVVKGKTATINSDRANFQYKYADLGEVIETVRPTLSANGLAVSQAVDSVDGKMVMVTRLVHKSGQFIAGTMPVPVNGGDPKQLGSVLTYYRRYAYTAIIGVATEEDDDGAAANATQSPSQPCQQPKAAPQRSQATNGASRADKAPAKPNDPIPFGDDGGEVVYVNTQGKRQPLDLADAISRLEKAAEATTSLPDEEFAALLNANAEWLCNRADAAMRALFAARNMEPAEWLR